MRARRSSTCRLLAAWAAVVLLATSPASAGTPLVEQLISEFSVESYTTTQQTIEDMGLGLYGGSTYNQGYRGRDASVSGTDSKGNLECQLYLSNTFNSLGLTTTIQGSYQNVVGELAGTTRPNDVYIIGAHFDTTTGNPRPGGDDNASGTAAIVELARILSQYQFEATIRLIAFNNEEDGLYGSTDYVNNVVKAGSQNVVGMVSLDMILHPRNDVNPSLPIDLDLGCPNDGNDLVWVNQYKAAAAEYVPDLLIDASTPFTGSNSNTGAWGRSDHQPFALAGYASFLAIENSMTELNAGANSHYHQPNDWSDGTAGAHYDYGFATLVTESMAAVLAVEAEVQPEPILFTVTLDRTFAYQNTPVCTAGRNCVMLTIDIAGDLNGNSSFTTLVTKTGGSADVQIVETEDPMVWQIVAGQHGAGAVGDAVLTVNVGGNEYGGEGEVACTVTVRLIGDIDGDGLINAADKLIMNQCLNGLDTPVDKAWCDLDRDGLVNAADKLMINQVLNGLNPP